MGFRTTAATYQTSQKQRITVQVEFSELYGKPVVTGIKGIGGGQEWLWQEVEKALVVDFWQGRMVVTVDRKSLAKEVPGSLLKKVVIVQ